jgi:hypothetical protein
MNLHRENWGVLVHTQRTQGVSSGNDGIDRIVQAEVPEANLAVTAGRDEFSNTTTLHMDVGNPLLMFTPDLNHRRGWLQALVKYANSAISKSSNEDISGNLVGR